jgi:predicted helicase
MKHMLLENLGLITVGQSVKGEFTHCLVTDTIVDSRISQNYKGLAFVIPLYLYKFPGVEKPTNKPGSISLPLPRSLPRKPNIAPWIFELLDKAGFQAGISPEQVFYYVYAVMFSTLYRKTYEHHFKSGFPCIPFTSDESLFMRLSKLGERLASVQLEKSPGKKPVITGCGLKKDELYRVEKFRFEELGETGTKKNPVEVTIEIGTFATVDFPGLFKRWGRVYIDDKHYFSNIPGELWEYKLCGYRVLEKWLRERKGKGLTGEEINGLIEIAWKLGKTVQYQESINELYPRVEEKLLRVSRTGLKNFPVLDGK